MSEREREREAKLKMQTKRNFESEHAARREVFSPAGLRNVFTSARNRKSASA